MPERQWLTLHETQLAFLDMLEEFDSICKKYGFEYTLCGGSLLGAVRHQGFIPWDDDIDVAFTRPDYERFLNLAKEGKLELPEGRGITSNHLGNFARHYSRYVRYDIGAVQNGFVDEDSPHLGLDIFAVDGMPSSQLATNLQMWMIRQHRKLMLTSVQGRNPEGRTRAIRLAKNVLQPVLKLIGPVRLAVQTEWWCKRVPYETATYVGVTSGMYGTRERWLKKDSLPKKLFLFEGRYYPGYENYDIYLTNLFGNYMEFPPEDKRNPHGSSAFWITESESAVFRRSDA